MADYGLFAEGLRIPTFDELVDDVITDLRPTFGASYDFSSYDPIGADIRVQQQGLLEVWQALEAVLAARTREGASGVTLASVLTLTGTPWPEASSSLVGLTLTGAANTTVPAASGSKSVSTGTRFLTADDATLAPVAALQLSHLYSTVGARVASTGGVYQVTSTGTTPGSGALTATGSTPIVFGATWRWLGAGAAAADVDAYAEELGPIVATSGDITEIDNPVGGWQGVINLLDATPGRNAATDGEARMAGEADVFRPAGTTPDAARQSLLDNEGVTVVDLIINESDATVDGVGPHGVEAIVVGGTDQEVADLLRAECIAGGIQTYGNTAVETVDANGNAKTIRFTRITDVLIYVAGTIQKIANVPSDPTTFPADGADQASARIVAWGNALTGGRDIIANAVRARVFGVAGVLDVPSLNIGTAPSPGSTDPIAITRRQRGVFDSSRISWTLTDGTP